MDKEDKIAMKKEDQIIALNQIMATLASAAIACDHKRKKLRTETDYVMISGKSYYTDAELKAAYDERIIGARKFESASKSLEEKRAQRAIAAEAEAYKYGYFAMLYESAKFKKDLLIEGKENKYTGEEEYGSDDE